MLLIYLDVCCLNRPFDNQFQDRVRLEAEAVLLILTRCQQHQWHLVSSEAVDFEVARIPDPERKHKVSLLASSATSKVTITDRITRRASQLEALGFKATDALHIACAEASKSHVLLTTDDQLLRRARMYRNILKVRTENPVHWLIEVIHNEAEKPDTN